MSEIRVKEGESLESALRRFKRSTARAGVLAEVRKREAYEKPSVKRKEEIRSRPQAQVQISEGLWGTVWTTGRALLQGPLF